MNQNHERKKTARRNNNNRNRQARQNNNRKATDQPDGLAERLIKQGKQLGYKPVLCDYSGKYTDIIPKRSVYFEDNVALRRYLHKKGFVFDNGPSTERFIYFAHTATGTDYYQVEARYLKIIERF